MTDRDKAHQLVLDIFRGKHGDLPDRVEIVEGEDGEIFCTAVKGRKKQRYRVRHEWRVTELGR